MSDAVFRDDQERVAVYNVKLCFSCAVTRHPGRRRHEENYQSCNQDQMLTALNQQTEHP